MCNEVNLGSPNMQDSSSFIRKLKKRSAMPLYQILASNGELDVLKSHVRSKLILELNKGLSLSKSTGDAPNRSNRYSDLANHIVLNHLLFHQFNYTMSVFVPESRIPHDVLSDFKSRANNQGMTTGEFSFYLDTIANSILRRKLSVLFESQCGSVIEQMLQSLEESSGVQFECSQTQTENQISYEYYDDRLRYIDRQFENRRELEIVNAREAFDQQLDIMRREMNEEVERKLKLQMDQFRETEVNRIRQELETNYQIKISESQKKLEDDYQKRLNSLVDQHRQLQQKTELARQADEREAYLRRQTIQAEVDSLRAQIVRLNQETDKLDKERQDLLADYRKRQSELDIREKKLLEDEQCFENRVQEEVLKCRLEDEARLLQQKKENEFRTTELAGNRQAIEREKQLINEIKADLMRQKSRFTEMEIADYEMIKTQNGELKTEVTLLRKQLAESLKDIREQNQKIAAFQSDLATTSVQNHEIDRLRECLSNERKSFNEERRQMQEEIEKQKAQMIQLVDHFKAVEKTFTKSSRLPESYDCYFENRPSNMNERTGLKKSRSLVKMNSFMQQNDEIDNCDQITYVEPNTDGQTTLESCKQARQSVDYWTERLQESRKRMIQLKSESEQLESAYVRWFATSTSKSPNFECDTLIENYLSGQKPSATGVMNCDVSCAISPGISASTATAVFSIVHKENSDKPKLEVCHPLASDAKEECAHINTVITNEVQKAILSKEQTVITAPNPQSRDRTSLIYDDTGVSSRTHASHSELSIEIDDNVRSTDKHTAVRTPIVQITSSSQPVHHGREPEPQNRCELDDRSNCCSHDASSKSENKKRSPDECIHKPASGAQTECDFSLGAMDGLSEDHEGYLSNEHAHESIRRSIERFDRENTPVTSARTEQSSLQDLNNASSESSGDDTETPRHESLKAGIGPGTDDLMQRYLELSKTTNRVSEAARIEERNSEIKTTDVPQENKVAPEKVTLMHFFNNHQFLSSDSDSEISGCEPVPELDELSTGREQTDQNDHSDPVW